MTNFNAKSEAFMADLRRAYRAEYETKPEIKAEFLSADSYAAYMVAMNSGRIKIMRDTVEAIENEAAARRAAKTYRFSSAH